MKRIPIILALLLSACTTHESESFVSPLLWARRERHEND